MDAELAHVSAHLIHTTFLPNERDTERKYLPKFLICIRLILFKFASTRVWRIQFFMNENETACAFARMPLTLAFYFLYGSLSLGSIKTASQPSGFLFTESYRFRIFRSLNEPALHLVNEFMRIWNRMPNNKKKHFLRTSR